MKDRHVDLNGPETQRVERVEDLPRKRRAGHRRTLDDLCVIHHQNLLKRLNSCGL